MDNFLIGAVILMRGAIYQNIFIFSFIFCNVLFYNFFRKEMPFYRKPRNFKPLLIEAAKRSYKNRIHHAVFTSRGDKYVGDWIQSIKNGKGFFLTIGGKLYEGDWLNGFRHGFGLLSHRLPNGIFSLEYRGEWVRGHPHGIGWRYYENGDIYFGFWEHGQKNGFGKMWYKNGTFYVGYWLNDLREGLGMFVQENANRYEGKWGNDKKNGRGRFYHLRTGQLQDGFWSDNSCIRSQMVDIIIRQFAISPTEYPIPLVELENPKKLLEDSEYWLKKHLGVMDNNLQRCIDEMEY